MENIELLRKRMFEAFADIQEISVLVAKNDYDKGMDIEEVLNSVTYDTIYSIMEMIDGYSYGDLKIDLVERGTNRSIKEGCELHDTCYDYLKQ